MTTHTPNPTDKTLMRTPAKRTVLYIEDDPASRLLVDRTLRHYGFTVLVAARGLEGVDMARRELPDIILTDINLPDVSGRELTTMLRSDMRFRNTPIVALTAQSQAEQRDLAMAAGLTGYLTKPLDVEALPGQLEYYLRGGRDEVDATRLRDAQAKYAQEVVGHLEGRIRALEASHETLERLDRMKEAFIQITAHELRTPLTLVYGYSRLLQDSAVLRAVSQHDANTGVLLEGLVHAIERMHNIINEILTISRIMTQQVNLSVTVVNLPRVAQRAVNRYTDVLGRRKLVLFFSPELWPRSARADADLLELVLVNLLSNAIKYTPDGGTITLNAQEDADAHLRLTVADTGIGVDPSQHQVIFDRFHTSADIDPDRHSTSKTEFVGGGLGLGLAICKGIVEAHGGTIAVESRAHDPQKCPGSTFIVRLPQGRPLPLEDDAPTA